jgi:hypothetical protein
MSKQPKNDQRVASENHAEGDDVSSRSYGRRALIVGAATAGAGAAVSLVARPEPAGAETPESGTPKVKLGKANTATATTSISIAVDGDTAVSGIDTSSEGGYGVSGTSKSGTGVYAASAGFDAAVYADATGEGASGVYAYATGEDGYGVYGNATGENGYGVYGSASADSASGVYGNASGSGGYGVYGYATGGPSTGVYGDSTLGTGVYGNATGENSIGVEGIAYGTGNSYGVYAYSEYSDSLYVEGSAVVTGTLSKGGGSFKIDHPLDPSGKYLYHSFVESPDMMNVYNGTVVLDADGRATVELPDWFEALNRDYRYQLTPIAAPTVVYVSEEIADGKFGISGGNAGQKVSWQVTGIRQDAWANANRIPVEVGKPEEDQGRYLHPELFGGDAITALARARDLARHRHSSLPVA